MRSAVVGADGPGQLPLDHPQHADRRRVVEPRGRWPFDARAGEVADEDDLCSQKCPSPVRCAEWGVFAKCVPEPSTLIEQILRAGEPHADGELFPCQIMRGTTGNTGEPADLAPGADTAQPQVSLGASPGCSQLPKLMVRSTASAIAIVRLPTPGCSPFRRANALIGSQVGVMNG